jgi:hypothetical protein
MKDKIEKIVGKHMREEHNCSAVSCSSCKYYSVCDVQPSIDSLATAIYNSLDIDRDKVREGIYNHNQVGIRGACCDCDKDIDYCYDNKLLCEYLINRRIKAIDKSVITIKE